MLHKTLDSIEDVAQELVQRAGLDPTALSVEHKKKEDPHQSRRRRDFQDRGEFDRVKAIEEVVPTTLDNDTARRDMGGTDITIQDTRYEDKGQVVAVSDTGFDIESKPDFHPAFTGRILVLCSEGRKQTTGQTDDANSHGTHVAGSVPGDGKSDATGGRIKGTALPANPVLHSPNA